MIRTNFFSYLCSCFFYSLNSFDYAKEFPIALEEMRADLISGKLKRHFHKIEGGIEEAPKALPMLFSGENIGKLCVGWEIDSAGETNFTYFPELSKFPRNRLLDRNFEVTCVFSIELSD